MPFEATFRCVVFAPSSSLSVLIEMTSSHHMQDEAKSWVEGFDHTGWLKIVKHFSQAFKTGVEPAITQDSVVLQARPHIRDATAPADKLGVPPFGFKATEDMFFGTVFATAPGKITVSSAPNGSDAVTSNIPAGVSKIAHPLVAEGTMKVVLTRNGKEVVNFTPKGFIFTATPQVFNYNAFVVASA
jgi:glucan endo-1,3-alpha-glucosidase